MEWAWAGIAIVGGFVLGTAASKVVRTGLERRRGRLAQLAPAAASLAFSLALVVGLLVALGFVQPDSLSMLLDDTIDYLPRVLSALIVIILGGVAGTIASTAARESLGRSMGRLGEQIPTLIKSIITLFAAILAASQLGIDTTVINIVIAAAAFGMAAAFALVVGFGGRAIASEMASGRALRRLVNVGDEVESELVSGTIIALYPTAVELRSGDRARLVPNSDLAASNLQITRSSEDEAN